MKNSKKSGKQKVECGKSNVKDTTAFTLFAKRKSYGSLRRVLRFIIDEEMVGFVGNGSSCPV